MARWLVARFPGGVIGGLVMGWLVARWFLGGEMVGGEIPWWRDDRIPRNMVYAE